MTTMTDKPDDVAAYFTERLIADMAQSISDNGFQYEKNKERIKALVSAAQSAEKLAGALEKSCDCLKDLHGMYLEKGHPNELIITQKIGQQIADDISAIAAYRARSGMEGKDGE